MTGTVASAPPTVVIEARPETVPARLRALWRYRGFYGFLFTEITMRRARGTLLGVWWLILRPLITAVGFIVAFSAIAPLPANAGIPYPVFFFSGFIPWRVFQATLTLAPRTLMWTRGIMQRTYFPRLLVPLAGIGPTLIEFAILSAAFAVVAGVMAVQGKPVSLRFGWETAWILPCLLGALLFALALGMVMGVVAMFFRDVVFTISYFAQMVMFLTPVLYEIRVPEPYSWLVYALNPMAQMVTVVRWALTGYGAFEPGYVVVSFAMIVVFFTLAVTFFLRAEAHLGDQL